MQLIDGKELSAVIKQGLKEKVVELEAKYGRKPCLAVIIVGDNPASRSYVRGKIKACAFTGMDSRLVEFPETVTQNELIAGIDRLNADDLVDGVLVQLPLPGHIDEDAVIDAISVEKDVDGFHPGNVAGLWLGKHCMEPCTPKGIMMMIRSTGVEIAGKRAVVIGRSNIVGKPVAKLLMDANATVTIAHSRTRNLAEITGQADILVAAIGRPKFVTADMVKPGTLVIDVGINRQEDGTLCGDVDFESVAPVCSFITPVPGGVGPMTIAVLMSNTVECFERRMESI